ncbi:MAG: hypothetical protein ACREXY_21435, partial [Gammaproteobacteria bacterium]
YWVYRCTGASCIDMRRITTVTGTTYQDTGLTANTTYVYSVTAFDAAGNLSSSAKATATTFPTTKGQNRIKKD